MNDRNTLKSITAYRDLKWDDLLDLDELAAPVAQTERLSDYDAFSQELQLVGNTDRFNYVGGLYYFKDDGFALDPQTFFFGTANYDSRYGFGAKAWAAFGRVDCQGRRRSSLAGLRYTRGGATASAIVAFNDGTAPRHYSRSSHWARRPMTPSATRRPCSSSPTSSRMR